MEGDWGRGDQNRRARQDAEADDEVHHEGQGLLGRHCGQAGQGLQVGDRQTGGGHGTHSRQGQGQ
eukprot:7458085-Heterocapsa_arctica.AAC.1